MLADIGCGSGLSSAALAAVAWAGTDVTAEMLRLAAARQPGCRGRIAQSDFCQGLPLRAGCLDGAISVSAVQWLCAAPDPAAAMHRFFASLRRNLSPGGVAAMQVYPKGAVRAQGVGVERCCCCRSVLPMVLLLAASKPVLPPPADDEQAQQLVAGARECGLAAAFCVSFPHATRAKK